MTHNENKSPDGTQGDSAAKVDVEEILCLLPHTLGNGCTATDPESVQRIKLKIRELMAGAPIIP